MGERCIVFAICVADGVPGFDPSPGAVCRDVMPLDFKYVDDIYIGAAKKAGIGISRSRDSAAVSQDVDIGESHVHGHWAKHSPLGIEIKGIPRFVPTVAAVGTLPANYGNGDVGFFHDKCIIVPLSFQVCDSYHISAHSIEVECNIIQSPEILPRLDEKS